MFISVVIADAALWTLLTIASWLLAPQSWPLAGALGVMGCGYIAYRMHRASRLDADGELMFIDGARRSYPAFHGFFRVQHGFALFTVLASLMGIAASVPMLQQDGVVSLVLCVAVVALTGLLARQVIHQQRLMRAVFLAPTDPERALALLQSLPKQTRILMADAESGLLLMLGRSRQARALHGEQHKPLFALIDGDEHPIRTRIDELSNANANLQYQRLLLRSHLSLFHHQSNPGLVRDIDTSLSSLPPYYQDHLRWLRCELTDADCPPDLAEQFSHVKNTFPGFAATNHRPTLAHLRP